MCTSVRLLYTSCRKRLNFQMAAHTNWPSLSKLSGEVRRSVGNTPTCVSIYKFLSRCARSERFTVSCSMHNNWCVEAIVYFRIVHCTAIPRWPRLRRASIHVGGRDTPCIPSMTWHNCIHHALRSTQWSTHVQCRLAQFSFTLLIFGIE